MGGGLESRCVGRVYGADADVKSRRNGRSAVYRLLQESYMEGHKDMIEVYVPFCTRKAGEEYSSHFGIQIGIHTSPSSHYFLVRGVNSV
jgi:hypothetical protein